MVTKFIEEIRKQRIILITSADLSRTFGPMSAVGTNICLSQHHTARAAHSYTAGCNLSRKSRWDNLLTKKKEKERHFY